MAHFARINENNIVEEVIVIANEVLLDDDGIEQEAIGAQFCADTFGGTWIQTSYNNNFRGCFASIGKKYDLIKDEFEKPEWVEVIQDSDEA
jgi:hypothetical protein